jgi:hypothetical protein
MHSKKRIDYKWRVIFFMVFIIILGLVYILFSTENFLLSVLKVTRQASLARIAMAKYDKDVSLSEISKTQVYLSDARDDFSKIYFLKFIPLGKSYYIDADNMLSFLNHTTKAWKLSFDEKENNDLKNQLILAKQDIGKINPKNYPFSPINQEIKKLQQ